MKVSIFSYPNFDIKYNGSDDMYKNIIIDKLAPIRMKESNNKKLVIYMNSFIKIFSKVIERSMCLIIRECNILKLKQ